MARGITAAVKAEVSRKEIIPVMFYEGEFLSGPVRVWSGPYAIAWNGNTWAGLGKLCSVTPVTESAGLRADGIVCTVSGVPNDLVQKALNECRHSHHGTLWLGFLDRNRKLVADPTVFYYGKMDVPTVKKGRKTSSIGFGYEKELLAKNPEPRRNTHEDQQIDYPGDLGFQYVNDLQDKTLSTGSGASGVSGYGTGGCFSGNTRILLPGRAIEISAHRSGDLVLTDFGPRPADLVIHADYHGTMLDMGRGELVTLDHEMRIGPGYRDEHFVPAERIFDPSCALPYVGTVYTLHVRTEVDEERHFLLENGHTAHNKRDQKDAGA
jgi:hypothetical protein